MTATLGDILLVFLADEPGTAYELQQRHAQTFGAQRAVDVMRVVSTLNRQERLGYVGTRRRSASTRTPRIYTLTEAGRRRQQSWIVDVPGDVSGPDVVDRVLLATAASGRTTFDAVLASCLTVLESQRPRTGSRKRDPVISARHARAELEAVVTSSVIKWMRELTGRPRERDSVPERLPSKVAGAE
jgi:DNA-binding PadR family transcriptional regulator